MATVELEHRLSSIKGGFVQHARLGKLHQDAVDRGQSNLGFAGQQLLEHFFCRQVAFLAVFKNLQHLQARQRDLESIAAKGLGLGGGGFAHWMILGSFCKQLSNGNHSR